MSKQEYKNVLQLVNRVREIVHQNELFDLPELRNKSWSCFTPYLRCKTAFCLQSYGFTNRRFVWAGLALSHLECQKHKVYFTKSRFVKAKTSDISKEKLLISVSGGQDSVFLLFLLELLQNQIKSSFSVLWCNHFWQSHSFYTTLHLTKTVFCFSSQMLVFLPSVKKKTVASRYHFIPSEEHFTCFLHTKFFRQKSTGEVYHKAIPCNISLFDAGPSFTLPLQSVDCTKRSFVSKGELHIVDGAQSNTKASHQRCDKHKAALCAKLWYPKQNTVAFYNTRLGSNRSCIAHKNTIKANVYKAEQKIKTENKAVLNGVLSEQGARNWRHLVTDRACTFYKHNSCVHGHTQSDRVETVLFNLIRGAGIQGVKPLQWERHYSSFSFNKLYPALKACR